MCDNQWVLSLSIRTGKYPAYWKYSSMWKNLVAISQIKMPPLDSLFPLVKLNCDGLECCPHRFQSLCLTCGSRPLRFVIVVKSRSSWRREGCERIRRTWKYSNWHLDVTSNSSINLEDSGIWQTFPYSARREAMKPHDVWSILPGTRHFTEFPLKHGWEWWIICDQFFTDP